jgi:hypothetical protein
MSVGQPIDTERETTTAFIGRALRGPVNEPVRVASFAEFRRRFGDTWTRSSLGPALRQFFEHGGGRAYVVRVANAARGAMLCLPASGSALVLRALEPGSTERIRAAVDYDRIDPAADTLFNLTLQRIDPLTGLVSDQEFYQRASIDESDENFVVDLLLRSTIVRVSAPLPTHRPEATSGVHALSASPYVVHAQDGTDGTELTDYDIVGSRRAESGLFALQSVTHFDLLYIPPPGKGRDLGPMSVLAADRYCRERGAMLIVDPGVDWQTADDAVSRLRELGYSSPNMIGYFPRLRHRDAPDAPPRTVGGAIAGMLCKLDRTAGAWCDIGAAGIGFNRRFLPHVEIGEHDAIALSRAGLNSVLRGNAGAMRLAGAVTLSQGVEAGRASASLPQRRLALQLIAAIGQGTRWAVFETGNDQLAQVVRSQVSAYLTALEDIGAFATGDFDVHCAVTRPERAGGRSNCITIHVVFQPSGCRRPMSVTLRQTVAGCRVVSSAFPPGNLH